MEILLSTAINVINNDTLNIGEEANKGQQNHVYAFLKKRYTSLFSKDVQEAKFAN